MAHPRFSTEALPEGVLVRVAGDIDMASAPALANAIAAAFGGHPRVIVDLDSVDYLDSSGLHVLAKTAKWYAGRFVVLLSTPRIRRMLDILGINGLLPVAGSLAEAQDYLLGR